MDQLRNVENPDAEILVDDADGSESKGSNEVKVPIDETHLEVDSCIHDIKKSGPLWASNPRSHFGKKRNYSGLREEARKNKYPYPSGGNRKK